MRLKETDEMFANDLRDPSYAAGYLNITLEDDGIDGFLYALQKVARAHGISRVASQSEMPRESLYRSLSEKGNPGIKPLARVLEALGLRLTVTPASQESPERQAMKEDQSSAELPDKDALAVLWREARAEQESIRRTTLEIQEETRRALAQMQQLTADMKEQVQAVASHR